jgi:hypothetical protein
MPRIGKKNIEHLNARVPAIEMEILRRYCEQTQRTQTDVIREFIRSLKPASEEVSKVS